MPLSEPAMMPPPPADEDPEDGPGEWLTKDQAVRRLPFSHNTFEKIVRDGLIGAYRVPGTKRRMFRRSDVDGLIGRFPYQLGD